MESIKANLIIIVFIGAIAWLGYWAVNDIKDDNDRLTSEQVIPDVGPTVTSEAEVPVMTDGSTNDTTSDSDSSESNNDNDNTSNGSNIGSSNDENGDLISKLQDLIADKILMKKGSRGTRVGTVQEFLNLYGIKIDVDNDYGDGTVNGIKKFQTDQKLSADGQAGATTFQKMIDWLNKN
jgi:hypothetical protein